MTCKIIDTNVKGGNDIIMNRLDKPIMGREGTDCAGDPFLGLQEHCGIEVTRELRRKIAEELGIFRYDRGTDRYCGIPCDREIAGPVYDEIGQLNGLFIVNKEMQSPEELLDYFRTIAASKCRIVFGSEEQEPCVLPEDLKLLVCTNAGPGINIEEPANIIFTHAIGGQLHHVNGSSSGSGNGFRIEVA